MSSLFSGYGHNLITPEVIPASPGGLYARLPSRTIDGEHCAYGEVELSTGHGIPKGFGGTGDRIYGVTVLWQTKDGEVMNHGSRSFTDHADSPEWPIDKNGQNYLDAVDYIQSL